MSTTSQISKISFKLPAIVIGSAVIAALGIGFASFSTASTNLKEAQTASIRALLESRKTDISAALSTIGDDLTLIADNPATKQAVSEFTKAWNALGADASPFLTAAYINDNPHPFGEKENLDTASTGASYDGVHAKFHPWFRQQLRTRGYYDIFLFDMSGNLVYSVFKESDYATNLNTGRWKDSDLGNAFRAAANTSKGEISFFDFKPYGPSADAPASFISTPIISETGSSLGVLVYQLPKVADELLKNRAGLGETGEFLLTQANGVVLNETDKTVESDMLTTRINSPAVSQALSTGWGAADIHSYRNIKLKSYALPLSFHGKEWALVAVQGADELNSPLVSMRNKMLIAALFVILVAGVVGAFVSKSITRPIELLVTAMRRLADGDTGIDLTNANRSDEIGDMTKAVAVFKDNAIERMKLEAEAEKIRQTREQRQRSVDALILQFETDVQNMLQAVDGRSSEMKTNASRMSTMSDDTSNQARDVASSSESATSNVEAVASAAEELSASISEIGQQITNTKYIVDDAAKAAESTNSKVAGLDDAAQKIGEVVNLISEIAEQTNLLALNATIEAARAGEMGKGFAVVASEVKELAEQTSKATIEISKQVGGIQTSSKEAVSAIEKIAKTVSNVNDNTQSIAAAVEEQHAATSEISYNVLQAAGSTRDVANTIKAVSQSASDTNSSASEVLSASQSVADQTVHLSDRISQFLSKVRAA